MKKMGIKESKVLLEVRRIKEQIAHEAEGDPGYYQRMNGPGARLMAKHRPPRRAESPSGASVLREKPPKYRVR
ncbi:MAG: hypothetical protein KGR98_02875 [Verrucomicrobia bacterium]|nr:hypothetical protein [Verrucomicrobiota bacterium]MDE3099552.1 hypothetical protein [Verrucomicrobiota bacterium]